MLRKFFTLVLLGLFFLISPNPVLAHVLKSDGPIGAVLHIDPDDDPIIGQEAYFYFEFKDKEGKFKPESCTCLVKISKEDTELLSQNLTAADINTASFSFTFPEKGVYKISIAGAPKENGNFSSFTLEYDLRVDRESGAKGGGINHFFHVFAIAGIFGIFLVISLFDRFRKGIKK